MNATHTTDLIVPLDCIAIPRAERALEFVDSLGDLPVIYRVGMELFLSGGPEIVRELVHRKKRVFLDLKFHDLPSHAARAARQAALLQVEMFSVHLAGGSQMVRAVADELAEISLLKPKVLGVSILSSFDDVRWAEVTKALTGHAVDVSDSVDGLIEHSVSWGADGVVCSLAEAAAVRGQYPSLYIVVPEDGRLTAASLAHQAGASAVVVGAPIIEARAPAQAAQAILKDLSISRIPA